MATCRLYFPLSHQQSKSLVLKHSACLQVNHTGDILGEDPSCFFDPTGPETHCDLEGSQTAQLEEFLTFLKSGEPWKSVF